MSYFLMTGSTGLLGAYLLRDGLNAGRRMAVLVRPSIAATARQRIEHILSHWEDEVGYAIPRPPVLEADICSPDLGLGSGDLRWIARNCTAVLHNAASLSFQVNEKSGEPYRSNVDGTRNVLELCRKTEIRQFHHVSTAYVCGLRTGDVLESELDVGQQSGNDYEKSKIQAETMVGEANFLDSRTIYRPAIIIGDSTTGYTTTFHGFYTPLKIGQALIDQMHLSEVHAEPLMAALGLSGQERKSLVPVDWVSHAITYLCGARQHHGAVYHLTPERAVPVSVICAVAEQVLREYAQDAERMPGEPADLAQLEKAFIDQMEVYRAYWRDDPRFDHTNYLRAAPHLPCPDVDHAMLLRTSRYALKTNFGWPRPQPVRPEFDVSQHLRDLPPVDSDGPHHQGCARVGMQVNGPGGGQWTFTLDDGGRPMAIESGLAADVNASLYLNTNTYRQCVSGQIAAGQALGRGEILIESRVSGLSEAHLLGVLQATATKAAPNGRAAVVPVAISDGTPVRVRRVKKVHGGG